MMKRMSVQPIEAQGSGETTAGRLMTADGRALPLVSVDVRAEAKGGLARTVLTQVFENRYPDPLQVTYLFPLPHGGAVSGFSFRLRDRHVVGEVDLLERARQRFEEALLSGRTAALLDQLRGSLFSQEIGNVPPGTRVEAELTVDQRLDWRDHGWEWRFPTAVAPRYPGTPGRVADAGRTSVDVAEGPVPPRLLLSFTVNDVLPVNRSAECPSHPLAFSTERGALRARLSSGARAPLDRDLVIRWPVAAPEVGVTVDASQVEAGRLAGRAFGLATVVPPASAGATPSLPRDLVVLLDTSGSMDGEPLQNARQVVGALIDSLGDEDRLELLAFGSAPVRFGRGPSPATAALRRAAREWLGNLHASGGTEMREGIREALRGVRAEAQRQVVLVTDGLIGFESEVVAEILATLPAGSRLHTVGVGSAVNRSLTGPAARAGRGLEVVIGLGEDPERAAAALLARTARPLLTDLEVEGSALRAIAPLRLPDVFAGAPALLALELAPQGGELLVRGRTRAGAFERRIEVPAPPRGAGGAALAALFGRESAEDLEMRLAAGEPQKTIDRALAEVGLDFQITTRLTSWVAVSEEPTVDPTRPTRRERVPQELPFGMSVLGLGLRPAGAVSRMATAPSTMASPVPQRTRRALHPEKAFSGPEPSRSGLVFGKRMHEETGAPSERRLGATVRRLGEERLVFEVEVEEALRFAPEGWALIRLDDGTEASVPVDRTATTAAGDLRRGQLFRLVLRTGLEQSRIREVRLVMEGVPLVLVVLP
ncbi:MAG TPA: VIT domain-containing protein [Anaeromyxobacter sp.]|nr:VIT domain-containing protein [Anaeromyxobacter sp.]